MNQVVVEVAVVAVVGAVVGAEVGAVEAVAASTTPQWLTCRQGLSGTILTAGKRNDLTHTPD